MRRALLAAALALLPAAAQAGAPYCPVSEICRGSNDNCTPAEGMLILKLLPSGKAEITLNDRPPLQSTVLQMQGRTLMIVNHAGEEHQLRLDGDGRFNYLISIPDAAAPKGKNQTLYRGTCVEG